MAVKFRARRHLKYHNSALDELEDDLPYIQYASVNGSSFSKNFLQVGGAIKQSTQKGSYFTKSMSDDDWSNCPSEFVDKSWIGYRIVYVPNNTHYLVMITEVYPVPGRIWTNYYNKDTAKWSGWKTITPS